MIMSTAEPHRISIRLREGIHLHVTDGADLQIMALDRTTARVLRLSGLGCHILMNLPKQWESLNVVKSCAELAAGKQFTLDAVQSLLERLYQLGFIEWMGRESPQVINLRRGSRLQWQVGSFDRFAGQYLSNLQSASSVIGWPAFVMITLVGLGLVISRLPTLATSNTIPFNVSKLAMIWGLFFVGSAARALGRAIAVQFQGIAVTKIWIGLSPYLLRPYLVTDADQLLWLCSAPDRVRIVAAGMLAEIWVAIVGFGVWMFLPSYNMISVLAAFLVILSLTRLILRLNPLMRSDGYWLLSHFWDMRQLHSQAIAHLKNWKRRQKNAGSKQKRKERRYISYLLGSTLCSGIMAYLAGSALWSRLLYGPPLLRLYTAVILIVMFMTLLPPHWKQLSWIREDNNRDQSFPAK